MEIMNKGNNKKIHISKEDIKLFKEILKGLIYFICTIPIGLIIGYIAALIYNL